MKKIILISITLVFIGCLKKENEQINDNSISNVLKEIEPLDTYIDSLNRQDNFRGQEDSIFKLKFIPVGEENFNKLVAYIEKNGFRCR